MPPVTLPSPHLSLPQGEVYVGDCLTVLPLLPRDSVDLCFADPPFNIGYGYDICEDDLSREDYLAWTDAWLEAVYPLLRTTASVWVASNLRYQADIRLCLDKAGLPWRDTICWHYTFGPAQRQKFTPSWVALHYHTVSDQFVFNTDAVRVPSARQTKYKDARANPKGKVPDNVWVESRVCGTFKERTGHPCQMPVKVLERVILACTLPGQTVLDPFAGSGTTLEAAARHGRSYVGVELSVAYTDDYIKPRLRATAT